MVRYSSVRLHQILSFIILICSLICWVRPVMGGQINVTSNSDNGPGTLREAILQANSGDTIAFAITGTIALDTQIVFGKNLRIIGPGPDQLAINGQDTTRLFTLTSTDSVFISGLTLRNGSAAYEPIPTGGAIVNQGFLRLESCVLHDNLATFGGAIENFAGSDGNVRLELLNCSFYDNSATNPSTLPILKAGGAIASNGRDGGIARIFATNCTFSNNECAQSGGAIYILGAPAGGVSFEGTNCTITGNTANGGGGIDNAQAEAIVLKNTIVAGNNGIAIRPDLFGALTSLGNNIVGDTGSVVWVAQLASDIIEIDALLGPLANNGNGIPSHSLKCGSPAIDAGDDAVAPTLDQRGQARIGTSDIGAFERNDALDILVSNNQDSGAGSLRQAVLLACPGTILDLGGITGTITLEAPVAIIQDVTIVGNMTSPLRISGNDMHRLFTIAPNTTADFSWLTFSNGYSPLFGGGAIQNKGALSLSYCTLVDNQSASGGAIANYGDGGPAVLSLFNCTFARNEADPLDGGAIDNRTFSHDATVDIINCSFSSNRALNKGGAIYNGANGAITFRNTLIGNSLAGQGQDLFDESAGNLLSAGHNLVEHHSYSVYVADTLTDILDQDPEITPLGLYGGPTPTYRLLAGSPAIDTGDNTDVGALDQRGEARIFNGTVDIGSYEYDPATSIAVDPLQGPLKIFPNPASDRIWIIAETIQPEMEIRLYSLEHKQVFQGQIVDIQRGQRIELILPELSAGMYILQMQTGEEARFGKLMIR